MDKNIVAAMSGVLAALLINSFVLYQAKKHQEVECYFQTNKGDEVHVRFGYSQPSKALYARGD
jgi:hypothetical protein